MTRKITMTAARIGNGAREKLRLGNIDARRDWGWAPDYVDAMLRIGSQDVPGDYIVATGKSHRVRDFVANAFQHVGIEDWQNHLVIDPTLFRKTDSLDLTGNPALALEVLGWKPTMPFDQIVTTMVDGEAQ